MRTKPVLLDRLKPWVRAMGYSTPLQRALHEQLRHAGPFRAVQIGAHDGITHDPYREHLIRPGWESIVVEPNPAVFLTLVRNYQRYAGVAPLNAAVGYGTDSLSLWMFDPAYLARRRDGAVLSTLVSHSQELMQRHIADDREACQHLHEVVVPCVTIESLLDQRGWPRLDALFVDVEGYEPEILLKTDLHRLDAKLIVFENLLLADKGAAIEARLARHEFHCLRIEGDTLAWRAAPRPRSK